MPEVCESLSLNFPPATVWNFFRNIDNCALLIPGYMYHEKRNDYEAELVSKVNWGWMKKTIKLHIEFTKVNAPNNLSFQFTSDSKNLIGVGQLKTYERSPSTTDVQVTVSITAQGTMGPVINTLLKNTKSIAVQEIVPVLEEKIGEYTGS